MLKKESPGSLYPAGFIIRRAIFIIWMSSCYVLILFCNFILVPAHNVGAQSYLLAAW